MREKYLMDCDEVAHEEQDEESAKLGKNCNKDRK